MQKNTNDKILIVDDSEINRFILTDILGDKYTIIEASNGVEAIQIIQKQQRELSLILLDLVMPEMDGLEVLALMNKGNWINEIPVIMISSETSQAFIERAYNLGATDFINRPFNAFVVRKRIANTIMLYSKQKNLINLVNEQAFEREKNNDLMVKILSHIVEFRNGESGLHILRVNAITEILLERLKKKSDKYNLSGFEISTIVTASSLHDIGKISVPDEILNKPGRLTDEEFEIIKKHSEIGAQMLSSMTEYINEPLLAVAYDICMYHHERYDGKGYPSGKKGDDIPISAQVVSIADVYDALTSERCYKKAIPHEKAIRMIKNGECGCFNPLLLECLDDISDYIKDTLTIKSYSKRKYHEIKKIANEMLNENKFSVANNSISFIEQERIKYEFFASVSQEIQFEYFSATDILSISEWCAEKFSMPSVIINPQENEKVLELLGGIQNFEFLKEKINSTSADSPIIKFNTTLIIDGRPRLHKAYLRVSWNNAASNCFIEKIIGKIVDIDDSHQKILRLTKQATVDGLTNIYNRSHAKNLIQEQLKSNDNYALMLIDIDNFKDANDTYGHMFGDNVLICVSKAIISSTRYDDICSRIGGDEFLIFIKYSSLEILESIIKRLYNTLNNIQYKSYNVSISMGIATTEQVGYDYEQLFKSADGALYYSKEHGKGAYSLYEEKMHLKDATITPIENGGN